MKYDGDRRGEFPEQHEMDNTINSIGNIMPNDIDYSEYTSDDVDTKLFPSIRDNPNIACYAYTAGAIIALTAVFLKCMTLLWRRVNYSRKHYTEAKASSTFKRNPVVPEAICTLHERRESTVIEMSPLCSSHLSTQESDIGPCPTTQAPSPPSSPITPVAAHNVLLSMPMVTTETRNFSLQSERLPFLAGTFFTDGPDDGDNSADGAVGCGSSSSCIVMVQVH